MSIVVDGTGKRATGTGLVLSTSGVVMLGGWAKWVTGPAHGTYNAFGVLSTDANGSTTTYMCNYLSSATAIAGDFTSANVGGSFGADAWVDDAWHLCAVAGGPQDGSPHSRLSYIDGSVSVQPGAATSNQTVNLDELSVPGFWGSFLALGKFAETFATVVADITQAQAILDAMWNGGAGFLAADHPTVLAVRSANYYWPLFNNVSALLGGTSLTNVGSTAFDSIDHPAVSHGAAAASASFPPVPALRPDAMHMLMR